MLRLRISDWLMQNELYERVVHEVYLLSAPCALTIDSHMST